MILVVGSNKGGSGKTTLATNLAVALSQKQLKVCLVDADPQGLLCIGAVYATEQQHPRLGR